MLTNHPPGGNFAAGLTTTSDKGRPMTTTYRILKIGDPRSRGVCYWFEIIAQRGEDRWSVGTYDTRDEARAALSQIKAAEAATV